MIDPYFSKWRRKRLSVLTVTTAASDKHSEIRSMFEIRADAAVRGSGKGRVGGGDRASLLGAFTAVTTGGFLYTISHRDGEVLNLRIALRAVD